jgi:phosphoglycerol transferase
MGSEKPLLFHLDPSSSKSISFHLNARLAASILICLLVASTGVYYAFFACFFLLVSGASASVKWGRPHHLLTALVLILIVSFGVLANLSPSLVYKFKYGENLQMGSRDPIDSERYGMKINQLILPATGHIIPEIARLKDKYNKYAPLVNENHASSLGAIGSLGFLILIAALLFKGKPGNMEYIDSLSILNISAVLLGTIGGFGSLFAYLISPQIRSYNRISVYIAFYSLFALILLMQHLFQKYARTRSQKIMFRSLLGVLLLLGLLDQITAVPNHSLTKEAYAQGREFVHKIEQSMPRHAMIFQLPYMPFPEGAPVHNLKSYELSMGYLHSKTLRWSFGAMKGREGDRWQRNVVDKPLEEFLATIYQAGFRGIYIDRMGYEDKAVKLEANLSALLDKEPLVSDNDRWAFFDTNDYGERSSIVETRQSLKPWNGHH